MIAVALCVGLILAGGVALLALGSHRSVGDALFRVLVLSGCLIGACTAVAVLIGGAIPDVQMSATVPGGPWVFGLDLLSSAFLLAITIVGAACALYGVPYLARTGGNRATRVAHALVAVLISGLIAVVVARAAVPFLIAWEIMAVVSYFLIVFEYRRPAVRRAGLLYLVATHIGTLALIALFAVWGTNAPNLTFAALAASASTLPAGGAIVLILALVAFGIKAGIVPFHVWLPEAHAAAPSHISALMSGLVIKMGIYGLMRVVQLFGAPPAWWGWVLLALGAASGVLGVVWALAQHDIKRLLAFHSVENIGIILLGLSTGILGLAYHEPLVATLGFAGATLHVLNHALFKSLLFLGAGCIIHATGTRDIDRLGGLARRMTITAATFLLASGAIVGLPPLNGFVSEWLVYRSLLRAGTAASDIRVAVLACAALALVGGLALACFAKVVGVVFLGTPRDAAAVEAHEAPLGMTGPMMALAAICAGIGLLPVVAVPPALAVGGSLAGGPVRASMGLPDPTAALLTVGTLGLGCAIAVAWLAWLAWAVFTGRDRSSARGETWGCGYPYPTARMQYTGSSFAGPLIAAFQGIAGVQTERSARTFATEPHDPVLDRVVLPVWRGAGVAARWLRRRRSGQLGRSLLYLVAAVVVMLLYLMLAGRTT